MPMLLLFVNRVLSIDLSCDTQAHFPCGRVTIGGTTASGRGPSAKDWWASPALHGFTQTLVARSGAPGVDVIGTPPHLSSHLSFPRLSALLVSLPSSYLNFTARTAATAFSRPPTTVYGLVKTWIFQRATIKAQKELYDTSESSNRKAILCHEMPRPSVQQRRCSAQPWGRRHYCSGAVQLHFPY
jgi:hypothetical protein